MTPGVLAKATSLHRRSTAIASVGVGLLGLASFGYLMVAGRALGPERFGAVAIFWIVLHTLGAGLFLPLEQHLSRELASGGAVDGRQVLRRAVAVTAAALAVLSVVVWLARERLAEAFFGGSTALVLALAAGTAAMATAHLCRGVFAGLGSWKRYGGHLAIDGAVRFGGACLIALTGSDSATAYAWVVVLGLGVATVTTAPGIRWPAPGGSAASWSALGQTLGWLLVASLTGLSLMNAAPIAVELLTEGSGAAASVGNFVAALTLARIPLFLFTAVQASLLPALSRHVGAGDHQRFTDTLRQLSLGILALAAVSGAVALALGPAALRLVFGPAFDIHRVDLALIAVASSVLMLVTTLAQALIAGARYRAAALAPLLGLAVFVLAAPTGDATLERRVSVALLLASTVTVLALAISVHSYWKAVRRCL